MVKGNSYLILFCSSNTGQGETAGPSASVFISTKLLIEIQFQSLHYRDSSSPRQTLPSVYGVARYQKDDFNLSTE